MKFNNIGLHRKTRRSSMLKRTGLVLVVLLVASAGVAAWKIKRAHDISVQRAHFAQADKDITQLTNELVQEAGKPASSSSKRSCDRPSAEWTDVPLFCGLDSTLFYLVDYEQANKIHDSINRLLTYANIRDRNTKYEATSDGLFMPIQNNESQKIFIDYFDMPANMGCSVTLTYYPGKEPPYSEYIKAESPVLAVSLSCSDKVLSRYY